LGQQKRGRPGQAGPTDQTGFYPLEKYQGIQFRWSETAAAVRVRADASSQSVLIKCVPNIRNLSETDLRLYFDGKRIPDNAISMDANDFEIRIDVPKSGTCKLGWLCRPQGNKFAPSGIAHHAR
jgi:hypothetical protein